MNVKDDPSLRRIAFFLPDVLVTEMQVEAVRRKCDSSQIVREMLAARYPEVAKAHGVKLDVSPRGRPRSAVAARAAREYVAREGRGEASTEGTKNTIVDAVHSAGSSPRA